MSEPRKQRPRLTHLEEFLGFDILKVHPRKVFLGSHSRTTLGWPHLRGGQLLLWFAAEDANLIFSAQGIDFQVKVFKNSELNKNWSGLSLWSQISPPVTGEVC